MGSEMMLLYGIIAFILALIAARIAVFFRSFNKEWRYISDEIKRTTGGEQERWKRARKRLLLSLLPFYNPRRKKKKSHH